MGDLEDLTRGLVLAMGALPPFPVTDYMARLYNTTRKASVLDTFRADLPVQPISEDFRSEGSGLTINGRDESDLLTAIAVQSIVSAIGPLNPSADKPNFRACVKQALSDESTFEDMADISALLFAEYINTRLKAAGVPSLETLHGMAGVFDELKSTITRPEFLGGILARDQASHHHTYSASLLFVLEYIRHGPGFTPHFGDALKDTPSGEVLLVWCRYLLMQPGHANQAGIDKITRFAVGAASMVSAPVVNGKLQPSEGGAMTRMVMKNSIKPAVAAASLTVPAKKGPLIPAAILMKMSDDNLEEVINNAIQGFESVWTQNRVAWRSMSENWINAVGRSARHVTQSTQVKTGNGSSSTSRIVVAVPVTDQTTVITTVRGQPLADWIKKAKKIYPIFFTSNSPNTTVVETRTTKVQVGGGGGGGCFIPGTTVATSSSDVPIEDIGEGIVILTNAVAGRVGVASDEVVVDEVKDSVLVGFNDEGIFATAGHVFHTTTGLRAVEPDISIMENPWLNVGKLESGHVLYRLAENRRSYDLVPIESIQAEFVKSQVVHGVHLREGDRSYHANGYQVAVNYPEITIKAVAAALEKLPREVRTEMLLKIKELYPLFIKLGLGGVDKLLKVEMKKARKGKLVPLRNHRGVKLLDMRRTMNLTPVDSNFADRTCPSDYHLPVFNIFDGTLSLDGELVHRVSYDVRKEELTWSRPLKGCALYEHGILGFRAAGTSGKGAVWITKESNPTEIPADKDDIVPFVATKATMVQDDESTNADDPAKPRFAPTRVLDARGASTTVRAGHVPVTKLPLLSSAASSFAFPPHLGPHPTIAQVIRAAMKAIQQGISSKRVKNWMKKIIKLLQGLQGDGEGTNPDPDVPDSGDGESEGDGDDDGGIDTDFPEEDEEDPGFSDPFVDEEDYYAAFFDTAEWPLTVETRSDCINPQRWGSLTIATYHTRSEGRGGIKTPIIIIPELDKLRDDLNSTRPTDQLLPQLYASSVLSNADGTLHGHVQLTAAAAISSLSDQYTPPAVGQSEEDVEVHEYPTRDLTFTNGQHKSNIVIPFLFYEMDIDFKWNMREFNGAVWEFGQDLTGYLGTRHFFESRGSVSEVPTSTSARLGELAQRRAEISLRAASTTSDQVPVAAVLSGNASAASRIADLLTAPAPVAGTLSLVQSLDTDDLVNKTFFSNTTLHQTSQDLIKKVMLYHMDEVDLHEFTNQSRPADLPYVLADGLDGVMSGLKEWVRTKYARAYISFSMSNTTRAGEETIREQYRLSKEEKDKIWYYWSGSGEGCLAREEEYSVLNELASAYALREVVDGALDPYISDPTEKKFLVGEVGDMREVTLSGGERWAKEMLNDINNPWFLGSMVLSPVNSEGSVPLNRWCSIMHGLSPKVESLQDYASELFDVVIQHFITAMDGKAPGDVEDILGYSAKDWIIDSIGHIIDLVLDEKSDLDPEMRKLLNDDLNALAAELNASSTATAEVKRELFLEQATIVAASVGSLMMAIPSALYGTSKSDMIHKLYNSRYHLSTGIPPKSMGLMRGFFMISMFSVYGVLTRSLAAEWPNLNPSQRVACGLMMTKVYLDGLTGCISTFRDWRAGSIANAAQNDIVDETVARATRRLKSRQSMSLMNGEATGEAPTRQNLADSVAEADVKKGHWMMRDERMKVWNERWNDRKQIMNTVEKGSPLRYTNMALKAFQFLTLLAGVACYIAMSVALLSDRENLTKLGKRLVYAQVAFIILEACIELVTIVAVGTLGACLPFVGIVIAIVGLVLALVFMFSDSQKEQEPPESQVETFLGTKAKPLIKDLPSPPPAKLEYTLSSATWTPGIDRTLTVSAKNLSSEPVTVQASTLSFLGGDNDACIFKQSGMTLFGTAGVVTAATLSTLPVGNMAVEMYGGATTTDDGYKMSLAKSSISTSVTSYDFRVVSGATDVTDDPLLQIPPNGGFRWHLRGTVNPARPDTNGAAGDGESSIQVDEIQVSGDRTRAKFVIIRE